MSSHRTVHRTDLRADRPAPSPQLRHRHVNLLMEGVGADTDARAVVGPSQVEHQRQLVRTAEARFRRSETFSLHQRRSEKYIECSRTTGRLVRRTRSGLTVQEGPGRTSGDAYACCPARIPWCRASSSLRHRVRKARRLGVASRIQASSVSTWTYWAQALVAEPRGDPAWQT